MNTFLIGLMLICSNIGENKISVCPEEVDVAAEFPGGSASFYSYISKKISYSNRNACSLIFFEVKFRISELGKVLNVEIIKLEGNCRSNKQKLKKVFENMPTWKPAEINGQTVCSIYRYHTSAKLE